MIYLMGGAGVDSGMGRGSKTRDRFAWQVSTLRIDRVRQMRRPIFQQIANEPSRVLKHGFRNTARKVYLQSLGGIGDFQLGGRDTQLVRCGGGSRASAWRARLNQAFTPR